jgi:hypothetical protein
MREGRSNRRGSRNALAGLSILATTGLIGTGFSYFRPIASYAAASGPCELDVFAGTTSAEISAAVGLAIAATDPSCTGLKLISEAAVTVNLDAQINPTFSGVSSFTLSGSTDDNGDPLVTLDGSNIVDGSGAPDGILLVADVGSFTVDSLIFANGRDETYGGAIYVETSTNHLTVFDSEFRGNTAGYSGGAIYMVSNQGSSTLSVTGSTFTSNSVTSVGFGYGGAISTEATISISGSTFSLNTAVSLTTTRFNGYAYGGAVFAASIETISGSTFSGNTAESRGSSAYGGAVFAASIETISDSTFTSNTAEAKETGLSAYGGAVYTSGSITTISDSTFSDNTALSSYDENYSYGGAVRAVSIETISDSTFSGNKAESDSYARGGAVFALFSVETISGSTFSGNTAESHSYSAYGGAVNAVRSPSLAVHSSTFTSNTAESNGSAHGGALSINHTGSASVDLYGSTFSSNTASSTSGTSYGGAVETNGYLSLTNSTFFENSAKKGAGIFSPTVTSRNSTIWSTLGSSDSGSSEVHGDDVFSYNSVIVNSTNSSAVNTSNFTAIYSYVNFVFGREIAYVPPSGEGLGYDPGTPARSAGEIPVLEWAEYESGNIKGTDPGFDLVTGLTSVTDGVAHTPVLKPLGSSTLVNAGDPDYVDSEDEVLSKDQTGITDRILDGRIDIGAVEVAATASGAASPPYSGPLIMRFSKDTVTAGSGDTIVVTGERLNLVSSCAIDGATVEMSNQTAESLSITLPDGIEPGLKNLVISSSAGTLTVQGAFTVTSSNSTLDDQEEPASMVKTASWTKNLNDGTVKMYAKNVVGAGKVQFMLNGKEVAWVRASDANDPKLRTANGFQYLVRTVTLKAGMKNVLEIYVDGERVRRAAYSY